MWVYNILICKVYNKIIIVNGNAINFIYQVFAKCKSYYINLI